MQDDETWLLDEGDRVIEKKAADGYSSFTPRERLIYCLWVADYGMRNAGDLVSAADLHPAFLSDGLSAAHELGLPRTIAAFSLSSQELSEQYFELFGGIVTELRTA